MKNEDAMTYAHEGLIYRPGKDLHETRYYIQHPANGVSEDRSQDLQRNPEFFRERWWDDGTILAGGREDTAMSVSKCFTEGKLSCHSMHHSDPADQLASGMRGPQACIQCHDDPQFTTRVETHTHHPSGWAGSDCLNCHVSHTTYALFGAIRTHQIEPPQVGSSAKFGVPNACNLCHLDKTLAWTQEQLVQWFGQAPATLSPVQQATADSLLWTLKGHAAQRAIAAWSLTWPPAVEASSNDWQAPFLAQLLEDPYGVVRYIAGSGMKNLPGFEEILYDFLRPLPDRQHARDSAVSRWESRLKAPSANPAATLQRSDGTLRRDQLARPFRERDTRPITIKE